jgi:hypothetical protein
MQLIKKPARFKKNFIRTIINQSQELDVIRKTWHINNSPQEVVDISQGKIKIKEEISVGKRYGTAHNYAFTKAMGIVGKAPRILNVRGQEEYYYDGYLKVSEFFDAHREGQPGDFAVYISEDEKGEIEITHTGIVISDDCIESKWGPTNAVFEHPIWYVPAQFGNRVWYFRLKISGAELLAEIQKKLQQKEIKERYDLLAKHCQQELFDNLKKYEQDKNISHVRKIYQSLEYDMNVHLDVPDENGITPLMHGERIGCEILNNMFEIYQAHRE